MLNRTVFLMIFLGGMLFGCSSANSLRMVNSKDDFFDCRLIEDPNPATGKELQVDTRRLNSNSYLISIKNVSDGSVYMPMNATADGEVKSLSYVTEKVNPSGVFVRLPSEADSFEQLNEIKENHEVRYTYFETKKGSYRVLVNYMTDPKSVSILNNLRCLFNISESDKAKMDKASSRIYSPTMKITLDISTPND